MEFWLKKTLGISPGAKGRSEEVCLRMWKPFSNQAVKTPARSQSRPCENKFLYSTPQLNELL